MVRFMTCTAFPTTVEVYRAVTTSGKNINIITPDLVRYLILVTNAGTTVMTRLRRALALQRQAARVPISCST